MSDEIEDAFTRGVMDEDAFTRAVMDDVRTIMTVLVYLVSRVKLSPAEAQTLLAAQCAEQANDWPEGCDRSLSPALLARAFGCLANYASTLAINVAGPSGGPKLFDRVCFANDVSPHVYLKLQEFLREHGQSFLEEADMMMDEASRSDEQASDAGDYAGVRFGVGMYLYSDHPDFRNLIRLLAPVNADRPNVSMVDLFFGSRESESAELSSDGIPAADASQQST